MEIISDGNPMEISEFLSKKLAPSGFSHGILTMFPANRASQLPPGRLATSATLGITSVTGAAKVAPKPGAMARHGIPLPSFNGHFREFDGEILDVR